VVWGEKVFLTSADPQKATRHVLCVDADNGQLRWQRDYKSTPHHLHPRNTFASSTPAVDSERVYVAWSTPDQLTLRALDHEGQEVWTQDLGGWVSQHGFGSSPIVYGDLVILVNSQQAERLDPGKDPGESHVMAFDRQTGKLRWSTPRTATTVAYSTPCVYRAADGTVQLVGCNTGDGIYALDAQSGKPLWSCDVFEMRTVASPIIANGLVLGSNGSGGFSNNYLVAVRAATGQKVYGEVKPAAYVATPIACGELVFTFYDRGYVHCFQAADGETLWVKRLSPGFSGSPIRVRDRLYCIDEEGTVFVLSAGRQFQKLAENSLGERSRSTPAVSGGRMFLRTLSQLICIGGQ
jgi:outer membrane protein assembly factor BamB